MSDGVFDVIIVGGGPAGLSCAVYCARAKLSTIVLDRSPSGGALASTGKIANYPGIEGPVPGPQVLDTMRRQALEFGAQYMKTAVSAADVVSTPKVAYTPEGTFRARAFAIATGSLGRSESIEGEEEFTGRGVSYCATCDAAFYQDKVAGVVGHNEAALEEALFLARFAREVHLVSARSHLSAPSDLLEEVGATPNVIVHLSTRVKRVVGDRLVTGLQVRKSDGTETVLPLEGVFVLTSGNAPITGFLGGSLELSESGCVVTDHEFATSVTGVYAIGDVTCIHPKQAIIAAAEGTIAALAIDRYLSGRERARVDYM